MKFTCRVCITEKEPELFPRNKSYKTGRATECKKCAALRAPLYRNPVKNAMWKYGLTEELAKIYTEITECAICHGPQVPGKVMCIDHNHVTGQVRGGLCDFCNKGLGQFRDNIELLKNAVTYLEKYT
jgi:hypothetical protein